MSIIIRDTDVSNNTEIRVSVTLNRQNEWQMKFKKNEYHTKQFMSLLKIPYNYTEKVHKLRL